MFNASRMERSVTVISIGLTELAAALLISFVATIYPARNASRIAPAKALRYE